MTQNQTEQEKQFLPIAPEEVKVLLDSAIKSKAKLMVWTPGQKISITTKVERFTESQGEYYITIDKDEDGARFEWQLKDYGLDECLFSLNLPTDVLFLKGQWKRPDKSFVHFRLHMPVFKIQRRRNIRLPVTDNLVTKATIHIQKNDPNPIKAQIVNVSEGGLGLIVDDEDSFKKLPVGQKFDQVEFVLVNIQIYSPGEVRYGQEISGTAKLKKQYRVGLQFNGLNPELQDKIAKFVFEESSKFIGRIG